MSQLGILLDSMALAWAGPGGGPDDANTVEERGRALQILLLGSEASPRATQPGGDAAKAAA